MTVLITAIKSDVELKFPKYVILFHESPFSCEGHIKDNEHEIVSPKGPVVVRCTIPTQSKPDTKATQLKRPALIICSRVIFGIDIRL